MSSKKNSSRRNFLRSLLFTGGGIGTASLLNTASETNSNEKIKMLTADGKLVEVNKSVLEKNTGIKRATDKEVFEWMSDKHKG